VREEKPIQDFGGIAESSKPLGVTRHKYESNISVKVKRNWLRIFAINFSVRDHLQAVMDKVVKFDIP
jgi:hypothetical protein